MTPVGQLKPCVCGSTDLLPKWYSEPPRQFWIHCDECGHVSKPGDTPHEAEANWNAGAKT